MGAISDVVNMAHWGRMRMWLLAIAVAMVGSSLLHYFGQVDLTKSVYYRPDPAVAVAAAGWRAVRCRHDHRRRLRQQEPGAPGWRQSALAGGAGVSWRISAYMTLKGLFGQWRVSYLDPVAIDLATLGLRRPGPVAWSWPRSSGLSEKTACWPRRAILVLACIAVRVQGQAFSRQPAAGARCHRPGPAGRGWLVPDRATSATEKTPKHWRPSISQPTRAPSNR